VSVNPYNGEVVGQQTLSAAVSVPPVVAGGMAYVVTDDATLVALR
jgi:outer membrane protein assembly factor BamB